MLETARLLLRPMTLADVDALLPIFADPKVVVAFDELPFDQARMTQWVRHNLARQAQHNYGLFSVVLKASGALIGDCSLEQLEVDGKTVAELGYNFRSDCWNQGFATEAAQVVCDHALYTLRVPRLVSLIRVDNHASRRVAEKLGMRREIDFSRYGLPYWRYTLSAKELKKNS